MEGSESEDSVSKIGMASFLVCSYLSKVNEKRREEEIFTQNIDKHPLRFSHESIYSVGRVSDRKGTIKPL